MSEEKKIEKIEKTIEVDADAEAVWNALVDGEELKRWFPLDARVTPGPNGAIWCSFGEGMEWESPIEVWEPQRRLRVSNEIPGDPPSKIAIDYTIESHGGKTVLRLVHSGFAKESWDDELDATSHGWDAFLGLLKHYLERHPGESRELPHFRHPVVNLPRAEAFTRTLRALGFDSVQNGDRFSVTASTGDHFEGVVKVCGPPTNLTTSLENWNDGWMIVEIEPAPDGCRPAIWISLFGDARAKAPALQKNLETMLTREFAG